MHHGVSVTFQGPVESCSLSPLIVWLMGLIYELFFATPCKHPHILVLGCTVSPKRVVFKELLVVSNQTITKAYVCPLTGFNMACLSGLALWATLPSLHRGTCCPLARPIFSSCSPCDVTSTFPNGCFSPGLVPAWHVSPPSMLFLYRPVPLSPYRTLCLPSCSSHLPL